MREESQRNVFLKHLEHLFFFDIYEFKSISSAASADKEDDQEARYNDHSGIRCKGADWP